MKKLLLIALVLTNISWAIPSQQQIKEAMQQNNPQLVEQLSKEVLQVKPNSAKAHYFLGEAYLHEGRKQLALGEFNIARSIDNSLSFAGSAYKFNDMVNEATGVGNNTTQTVTTTRVVRHHDNSALFNFFGWFFAIIAIIFVLIIIFNLVLMFLESRQIDKEYKKRILARDNQPASNPTYNYNSDPSQDAKRQYTTHNPIYTGNPNPQTQATTNHYHGSNNTTGGMGGNGFVNGMVAGVVLDELLSNRHHGSSHGGAGYSRDYDDSDTTTTTTRSSSWDDSRSSSSSSIWDSGSDSSSSWDSGSSGSSDW